VIIQKIVFVVLSGFMLSAEPMAARFAGKVVRPLAPVARSMRHKALFSTLPQGKFDGSSKFKQPWNLSARKVAVAATVGALGCAAYFSSDALPSVSHDYGSRMDQKKMEQEAYEQTLIAEITIQYFIHTAALLYLERIKWPEDRDKQKLIDYLEKVEQVIGKDDEASVDAIRTLLFIPAAGMSESDKRVRLYIMSIAGRIFPEIRELIKAYLTGVYPPVYAHFKYFFPWLKAVSIDEWFELAMPRFDIGELQNIIAQNFIAAVLKELKSSGKDLEDEM
jgi:hypothetical protein